MTVAVALSLLWLLFGNGGDDVVVGCTVAIVFGLAGSAAVLVVLVVLLMDGVILAFWTGAVRASADATVPPAELFQKSLTLMMMVVVVD